MKDRFNLEEEITSINNFCEQIDLVTNYIISEVDDPCVCDTLCNALNGISTMLSMHSEVMLDTMCQCFELDDYYNLAEKDQQIKHNIKKCCSKWDTSSTNPIDDMSYDPN